MTIASHDIGRALREAREGLNYSLEDLAETCGLTVDEISEVEAGTAGDPDHAHRIASSLGVKID